ncbi:hypothetical protein, partial [Actinoalloteichus caeruleus]|uniref:hypothetical protein n=1 Tax=Actinoalloteichus cyanogriseus TaxID=2893586 RepID=UPI001B80D210
SHTSPPAPRTVPATAPATVSFRFSMSFSLLPGNQPRVPLLPRWATLAETPLRTAAGGGGHRRLSPPSALVTGLAESPLRAGAVPLGGTGMLDA